MTAFSSFWGLGHPLWEVDDARYAEVPREMAASGDWATPTLNELSYIEKPPLWYWAAAASYKIFGVSEAAARLPLALFSILGLMGVLWLGSWLYDRRTGLVAAIALGTSALYFFLTHYITPDLPLTVFLLWSTAMILRVLMRPDDAAWAAPLAWACAALGFLSKGLVAVVFPAGWTIACAALWPDLRRGAARLISPAGLALFLIIAAPWPILMQRRHPDFFHTFFVEQHFQRFATQRYNRGEPWYFFLLVLPAGLLPWTPALFSEIGRMFRGEADAGGKALLLWAAGVTAFFSSSHSKLATYVLPVFPHLCLLGARSLERGLDNWAKRLASAWGGVLVLAGGAVLFIPAPAMLRSAATWGGLGLAALGAALLFSRRDAALRLGTGGLLLGALALRGGAAAEPALSARPIAREIMSRFSPGDRIYSYGIYLHGLPFYAGRRVDKVVNWIGELHYAKRDPAAAPRFGDDDAIKALPPQGKTFVVTRNLDFDQLAALNKSMKSSRVFGRWTLAEF